MAETFFGSESFGLQAGGASDLSGSAAESVLMMLSRYPVLSERLKEAFRQYTLDDRTYGTVCRVWRDERLAEASKILGVELPAAGERRVHEEAMDGTEAREEGGAKEGANWGRGPAAHGHAVCCGGSTHRGGLTRGDPEDSFEVRGLRREFVEMRRERRDVEGKTRKDTGASSPLWDVSQHDGQALADPQKGVIGGTPGSPFSTSHSTLSRTNTVPSSGPGHHNGLDRRACSRGRCRARRVSATASGHGAARQHAEDERERDLCRWTPQRVSARGEAEVDWTGDAEGGASAPSLQLMAYCIKRLENRLRKKVSACAVFLPAGCLCYCKWGKVRMSFLPGVWPSCARRPCKRGWEDASLPSSSFSKRARDVLRQGKLQAARRFLLSFSCRRLDT